VVLTASGAPGEGQLGAGAALGGLIVGPPGPTQLALVAGGPVVVGAVGLGALRALRAPATGDAAPSA
jgi:hypothetical protein